MGRVENPERGAVTFNSGLNGIVHDVQTIWYGADGKVKKVKCRGCRHKWRTQEANLFRRSDGRGIGATCKWCDPG